MKRLLVYTTQLMETGGIESHILEFCDQLAASGIELTLVVPNFQMKETEERRLRSACRFVYLNTGRSGARTMSWLLKRAVMLGLRNFDALYTNGQGDSPGIFAGLIRKKQWVHHHHTAGDAADQASWSKRYWLTLKKANAVIACSISNAHDMKSVLERQVNVVPCFSRKITRQVSWNAEGKIRFGYYGRLIKEKGIDLLCRLAEDKDCRHIEFHIWGQGKDYPDAYFQNFPAVKYHGTFKGLDGLIKVINAIDAFLLISTHPEGLPVCLLEAMGAGLPWLATDKGGISDIALDPVSTRVIAPGLTYPEVKQYVLNFAHDIREGKTSRSKQVANYEEHFAASVLVDQWREVLQLN